MAKAIIGIFEVLDALEAVIEAAPPAERKVLAKVLDSYARDFPEEYFWAIGMRAPSMLNRLLNVIDYACQKKKKPKAQARQDNLPELMALAAQGRA